MARVMVESSLIGQTFSHYRILDEIAVGGTGSVYRAEDLEKGSFVAIKLLHPKYSGTRKSREIFKKESRALASAKNPGICSVHEIGEGESGVFIVMEYLQGETLDNVIARGPLETDDVLTIGIQVAEALGAAHAAGVLHRDLRPENIFINDKGEARVLNFGLARLTGGAVGPTTSARTANGTDREQIRTDAGTETIAYLSPEQALGEELDGRSDIFGLGVTIYEMLTGCQPFTGPTVAAVFDGILHRDPISIVELNPDLPEKLDWIIGRALEKDRDKRYPTARQMLTELKQVRWGVDSDSYISQQARILVGAGSSENEGGPGERGGVTSRKPPHRSLLVRIAGRVAPNRMFRITVALLLAFMIFLAAWNWLGGRADYFPCIVIGDLATTSQPFDSDLVEFLLQRTLSQYPEVRSFTAREFEIAVAQQFAASGRRQPEPLPSLKLTGEIEPSVAGAALQIHLQDHGHVSHETVYLRGADDLLGGSLDSVARTMLENYDDSEDVPDASSYRPISELLTSDWDALRYFWEGEKAWARLNLEDAERWLRSAFEIDPEFALAHLRLAEVKMYRRQFELAQQEVTAAAREASGLTELDRLRIEAIKARIQGQPFEERKNLRQLVSIRPYRKEYLYDLAESYFHTADVEEAIADYRDVLRLDPTFALAYNHLGYCYSWKGEHAAAISTLERYLEIDHTANAYDSLGDAYLHSGDYPEAIRMKSRALELNPNQYHTKRGIGFLLVLQGKYREAERILLDYLQEATTEVENASHRAALAFLYYSRGELEAAEAMCRAGLSLVVVAPYDEEMLWLEGLIAVRRGNLAVAQSHSDKMEAIIAENSIGPMNFRPIFKHWLHLQASIHARANRRDEALSALRQLLQIREKLGYWATPFDRTYFLYVIGQVYEGLGALDEAEKVYRDGLAYNPNFALIHYRLGNLLREKGETDTALAELQRFLELWEHADRTILEVQATRKLMEELL